MFNPFDICERMGEKLGNQGQIQSLFESAALGPSQEGLELSLAHGWPGLALFYSTLNEIFPSSVYESLCHHYLERSVAKIEAMQFLPLSLFEGLAGVCFSAHACSKEGRQYRQLLAELDRLLIDKLEEHLSWIEYKPHPETYYLAHGISGCMAYFLSRQNHPFLSKYAKKCLSKLVELMQREQTALGRSLPGWYEPPEEHWSEEQKTRFPNGKFSTGFFLGVAGLLASLSIAASEGIQIEGLKESVAAIADWLKNKSDPQCPRWPWAISLEEETSSPTSPAAQERDTLFIARSLYLAGKALNRKDLKTFAVEAASRYERAKNREDLSFLSGKAGDLAIVYHLSRESQSPLLFKKAREMEADLARAFDPSLPFGFPSAAPEQGVGMANGAAGITLSLLLAQDRGGAKWDRMFFLR